MNTLTIDIETEPDSKLADLFTSRIKAPKIYKDIEKIKAYVEEKKADLTKQMSVDVDFCSIKCIGVKENDEPAKIVTLEELLAIISNHVDVKSEMASEYQNRALNWRVVTFNGKHFDCPIITRQALKNGITAPYKWLKEATKRYDTGKHIDLMEFIGDGEYKSLDTYTQIYLGEEPKPEIDFVTCSQEELETHCLNDVELTYKLYNKFKPLM